MTDESMTKIGLLMETALTYQHLAEDALSSLKSHTQGLDAIVREEVRRTFVEELHTLSEESQRATQAIQAVKRAANGRMVLWSIVVTALCAGMAGAIAFWTLPSKAEIAALRAQHDQFATAVAQLEQRGGRIDLRRCANGTRLCVRIDREAPAFGEHREYMVVQGY
jgi:hypothetical protein